MPVSSPTLQATAHKPGQDAANALPVGHRLREFELRGVIGVGGFGIVYRAFDHSLEREVAIKEYLPAALAGRAGKQQVSLLSAAHSETFALGMSSFVNEAKLLARFDHPSLVKVHRFWEGNGTAYMVMPLYRGSTLRQLRQHGDRCPDAAWLQRVLDQLLGALEVLHREGVYHRDIAPDNIIVADDAPPVLLDFGAARRVISDRSQALTAVLKPSYAPLEQYAESTGLRQGPWTDFYALGATLHFMITGRPPVPATARALSDDQPRLAGSQQGGMPDVLLQACDWMLAPRPHERPQNVAEVRAALAGRLPVPQRERPASEHAWHTTVVQQAAGDAPASFFGPSELPVPRAQVERTNRTLPIWAAAVVMVAMAAAGMWWASGPRAGEAARAAAAAPDRVRAGVADVASTRSTSDAAPNAAREGGANTTQAAGAEPGPRPAAAMTAAGAGPVRTDRSATGKSRAAAPAQAGAPRAADARVAARPRPAPLPERTAGATSDAAAGGPPVQAGATGQAPIGVAAPTRNPREHCAGRHLVALHRCLVRECNKPEYQGHRECQKVRAIEARARNALGG